MSIDNHERVSMRTQHRQLMQYLSKIHTTLFVPVALLTSGTFIAQAMILGATPFLTRLYSPAAFNYLALTMAVIQLVSLVTTLRIEHVLTAVHRPRDAMLMSAFVVRLATVICIPFFLTFLFLYWTNILHAWTPQRTWAFVSVLPIATLLFSYNVVLRAILLRAARFKLLAKAQIARGITIVVASLIFAMGPQSLSQLLGLVFGLISGDVVFLAILAMVSKKRNLVILNVSLNLAWKTVSNHWHLVSKMWTSQIVATLYLRAPIFVIGVAYGVFEAGLFALAERVTVAPASMIAVPIGDVYRSKAGSAFRASRKFFTIYRQTLLLTGSLAFPIFVLMITTAPFLSRPIFGAQWTGVEQVIQILSVLFLFNLFVQPIDKGAIIVGATSFLMRFHCTRLVLEILVGAAAVAHLISFYQYLALIVVSRITTYCWQLRKEYVHAKTGRP